MKLSSVSHCRNSVDSWITAGDQRGPPIWAGSIMVSSRPTIGTQPGTADTSAARHNGQKGAARQREDEEHRGEAAPQPRERTLVEPAVGLEVHDRLAPV